MKTEIRSKFTFARSAMLDALIERDEEIDIVLTALIAGEHPLLVGPPGTAKSYLIASLMRWMGKSVNKFEVLFNRFTTPEEVFGPISVTGLEQDEYRRVPTGRLQEAHLGFGDEIFKASTAILGTLLRALNERTIEECGQTRQIPLLIFLAASNEWPQDGELGALFDRFLLRRKVKPIRTRAGNERLLKGALDNSLVPKFHETISVAEVRQAHIDAMQMTFTPKAWQALLDIISDLAKEGIRPGDRRRLKAVHVAKAYAYLSGDIEVEPEHLSVLAHVLWDDPAEQPEKCYQIVGKIANPTSMAIADALARAESAFEGSGSKYEDIASKLDSIQKELKAMSQSLQRDTALLQVGALRKENYSRILGVKTEGDE